jgi:hypothetical protein
MKYGRKIVCLRLLDKVGKEAETKQCGGGGGGGMNPRGILTGLRGQRGEVVRWMVKLPPPPPPCFRLRYRFAAAKLPLWPPLLSFV